MEELFASALGIETPIYVSRIEWSRAAGELHIYLDFIRGGRFACPDCQAANLPVHDTLEKTWRHLNFFQYKCYLHFRTPRTDCPACGVQVWTPPWSRKHSGFTMLFEAFVMTLAKEMPIEQIGELVGEHDTRIWRIVDHHVGRARQRKDFSGVKQIGVDETSSRKGHNYVTVFADMESGTVMFATKGKDAHTVQEFAEDLSNHNAKPEQIEDVAMDMSPAFQSGVAANLPRAAVTFDKFHVIQSLNKAVDEVRRIEQKDNPLLKNSRYIWLKNERNLTARQAELLGDLRNKNLQTARAYQMKLTFQDIYRSAADEDIAAEAIRRWLSWARRSRLDPIKRFAKTADEHLHGILRHFTTRLTSGLMEGINSRIQELKRRAKGYRNINHFITMIYLKTAGLQLELPT